MRRNQRSIESRRPKAAGRATEAGAVLPDELPVGDARRGTEAFRVRIGHGEFDPARSAVIDEILARIRDGLPVARQRATKRDGYASRTTAA